MLKTLSLFALACIVAAPTSFGALATISGDSLGRDPSAAELGGNASLAGRKIYEFFVTADSDILSVDNVFITTGGAALFQDAAGSDTEPPNPLFIPVFPAITADSWISTPGTTSVTGTGFAADNNSWFDSTNDGAVTNFMFARLTTSGQGSFVGRVNLLGPNSSVENFAFDIPIGIPEPATFVMAGMGLIGIVAAARRRK